MYCLRGKFYGAGHPGGFKVRRERYPAKRQRDFYRNFITQLESLGVH